MTDLSGGAIFEALWNAAPQPGLAVDAEGRITAVNSAAELFLGASASWLTGRNLLAMVGRDSRLADLIAQVRSKSASLVERGIEFHWPEHPARLVDLQAAAVSEAPGWVMLSIQHRSIAERIDRSLTHRHAARSIAGMSAMMAHEIRNPLAGISGAAQLLEMGLDGEDADLARLIQRESGRIGELVARIETAGETKPAKRAPVNIHTVLDQAQRAAAAGFGAHARFVNEYDPSLPPAAGDPDLLMQVFQNLLKNASEAIPAVGGIITLRTRYRPGVRIRAMGGGRESLPLEISVLDNGGGVPEEIKQDIFDPFVSSKSNGSGLGLALVSKIVADHGGVVECESEPGRTAFRILMPIWVNEASAPARPQKVGAV